MAFATVAGSTVYYEMTGNGPPLLLVTGLAGVASYWKPNLSALEEHFTVIRYDHRGTGRSERTEGAYSTELLADDLLGLMDELGLAQASLLGHSTGGAIGQVLAAARPDRIGRMILYGSWSRLCPQMRLCMEIRRLLLAAHGPEAYHKASPVFLYPPRFVSAAWPRLEADIAAATAGTTTASILDARIDAVLNHDGTPYLPRIKCPTLVLVAQDDILTPVDAAEELAAGIAGARLEVLPYGAHAVSACEPTIFNDVVLGFLNEARTVGAPEHA